MDKMRAEHVQKIYRLRAALSRTSSPYLKRDYTKALKRMERELKEYDEFKRKECG